MSYLLIEKEGLFHIEDLRNSKIQARALATDITYYFYTQSINSSNGIPLYNIEENLPKDVFHPDKEVIVAIHGWQNDFSSPFATNIKLAILNKYDVNFIIVDWGRIAKMNYVTAKYSVQEIGKYVGSFIENLASTYDVPLWRITVISHSLGAHIAGVAGTVLKGKIGQIIGLDPAGPLVSITDLAYRLDPSDAQFVQVIHTNGGLLGLSSSIGHTDYYPNGGKRQPGCGFDITGSCAHSRSYLYYTESIGNNQFISRECSNYHEFFWRRCHGRFSFMGGYDTHKGITGDFYLNTNGRPPYAKGDA
ncbi:hypothetical protein NQ317_012915 [Molorchus minor]|uniref:Lipase domain-containing protein n=1 Tax=Molorchus minor TaxID=1323400 RepID=A0ABQ9J9T9_9CUCU|nr:hypothetical protein NQ317_012915 [Molorchus minor]